LTVWRSLCCTWTDFTTPFASLVTVVSVILVSIDFVPSAFLVVLASLIFVSVVVEPSGLVVVLTSFVMTSFPILVLVILSVVVLPSAFLVVVCEVLLAPSASLVLARFATFLPAGACVALWPFNALAWVLTSPGGSLGLPGCPGAPVCGEWAAGLR
jgi:hypothetical protein